MITRFPGLTPTRSRAVATDDLVFTVAVAPDPVAFSVYEQSRQVFAHLQAPYRSEIATRVCPGGSAVIQIRE